MTQTAPTPAENTTRPLNVAVVGCGVIATPYARDMKAYGNLRLHGCFDLDAEKAAAYAAEFGARQYASLDELLADPEVELVVNLTVLPAHYDITKQALQAGKHVFSEKPLAGTAAQAWELVDLARERGVRLGCAPMTFLGASQQRALRELRGGVIGDVRVIYAETNHGRIETWHPVPFSFYEVGPLRDVGVYPLGVITSIFGPARSVWAYGTIVKEDRVSKRGVPYKVSAPDFYTAVVELEAGPVVRLTSSFYVNDKSRQSGIEFHGDTGSLFLSSWFQGEGRLELSPFGQPYAPLEGYEPDPTPFNWALALTEMASAIHEGRPHRVTGEQAAHIVEILEAAHRSIEQGGAVEVRSRFTPAAPVEG